MSISASPGQGSGSIIGILERWFVFVFIMAGRWEALGFLVAAKICFSDSGDLRQSKETEMFTEYILIWAPYGALIGHFNLVAV